MIKKRPPTMPFDFAVEQLEGMISRIRPMFGCYAIYVGEKLVLILRNRNDHTDDNGVWLATSADHHKSLKKLFPSLRPVYLLGEKVSSWQNIPAEADDFEESVIQACDLIRRNDVRIGKIPKLKKKKAVRKR
jgi:hypothetical protein